MRTPTLKKVLWEPFPGFPVFPFVVSNVTSWALFIRIGVIFISWCFWCDLYKLDLWPWVKHPVPPVKWVVHLSQNGTIGLDPQPYREPNFLRDPKDLKAVDRLAAMSRQRPR